MKTKRSLWSLMFLFALMGVYSMQSQLRAADPPNPPEFPPVVHILALDPDASEEGSDPATFIVLRLGSVENDLTVAYELGGTAENGVDYEALSGFVTIPQGAYLTTLQVNPIDDFLVEGGEVVLAALQQPLEWPPPYIVNWPSLAMALIEDNDAEPTNQPPVVKLINPPDGAVFTAPVDLTLVARASDPDGRVRTVEFFANGDSLGIITNRLPVIRPYDIAVDDLNALLEIDPQVFPDLEADLTQRPVPIPSNLFRLLWKNVPPGEHVLTAVATDNRGGSAASELVAIKVMDAPPQPVVRVRATDPEAAEPDPTGTRLDTATFVIGRAGETDFPLTVWYRLSGTAVNGEDYAELPHSVTIPEGESRVEVVVEPLDDNLVEGDESVLLTIVPPICIAIYPPPRDCYIVGQPSAARAVIHDNDVPPNRPPVAQIVRPLDGSVFLASATIPIAAVAWDVDGRVVSVEFFEGTNSLGIAGHNAINLNADRLSTAPDRPPFMLTWSNVPPGHYVLTAVARDNDGARGRSRPVEIKVVPRPLPPVVTIKATDAIASEPGVLTVIDDATFEVSRTGNLQEPLLVRYSIDGTAKNGVDYRELPGHVVIPRGDASVEVVLRALHDVLVEGPETVYIKIEPPVCIDIYPPPADCYYAVGNPAAARAVVRDNDDPPANVPPKVAIVRPQEGDVFRAFSDIGIYANAFDRDGWVRTVEFFEGGNSLGIITNRPSATGIASVDGLTELEASLDRLFRLSWKEVPPGGYVLTAKATDNLGASSVSEPAHIRVMASLPPVVTIHATDPYASEGDIEPWPPIEVDREAANGNVGIIGPPIVIRPNTATFTARRSGVTNVDLTVYYGLGGTASNGEDYRQLSGHVTIPRGAWSAEIVVIPIDDNLVEKTETVVAELLAPPWLADVSPIERGYVVGDPGRAVAYIQDNDLNLSPKVEIVHPADESIFRTGSDVEIGVVALDPDGWVSCVEFYEGANKIGSQCIYFIVAPPPGQVQKFSMTWTNVPAGSYVLTARATDNRGAKSVSDPIRIRVQDGYPLPVVTVQATDPVGSEIDPRLDRIPDPAVFTVVRTGDLSEELRVSYRLGGTATNGKDYEELSGEVVIPVNSARAEVVVDVIDDELVEGTESVTLALVQLRCVTTTEPPVPGCYIVGQPGQAVASIRDNDSPPNRPPTVAIVNPPNGAVFRAPADIRLVAAADDPDGWVATVEFFANNASLGIVTNRPWIVDPVRFDDLSGAVLTDTQQMPVPIRNPFMLNWPQVPAGKYVLTAVATDNLDASTRSRPIEIEVMEPAAPPVVRIVAVDGFAREGTGNTAAFLVFRVGDTGDSLTVQYSIQGSAENGTDYESIPGIVTIPEGRRSARIRIVPIDDRRPEPIETVILRLQPSPLDVDPPPYTIGRPSVAGAIIVDNDCPRPLTRGLVDGRVHIYMPLPEGTPYRLEASKNLRDWEPVIDGVVAEDEVHFVEEGEDGGGHRFYRVVPEVEVQMED